MGGKFLVAALLAAALCVLRASADELPRPIETTRADATTLETSLRLRSNWSEIAFRSNRPKAWDNVLSPEARVTMRLLNGLFEAKAEIGFASDNFAVHAANDADTLRGEVGLGVNTGKWTYLVEWKTRNVFEPGYGDFRVGLNTYDARIRHRFQAALADDMKPTLFQLSAAAGYVASTPHLFAKNFAEIELEIVQRFGDGVTLIVAPRLELSDYLDFDGEDRKDAVLTLRVAPTLNIATGLTLSLEGQAVIAVSTLDTKTGESWEVTPIIRLQKAL